MIKKVICFLTVMLAMNGCVTGIYLREKVGPEFVTTTSKEGVEVTKTRVYTEPTIQLKWSNDMSTGLTYRWRGYNTEQFDNGVWFDVTVPLWTRKK